MRCASARRRLESKTDHTCVNKCRQRIAIHLGTTLDFALLYLASNIYFSHCNAAKSRLALPLRVGRMTTTQNGLDFCKYFSFFFGLCKVFHSSDFPLLCLPRQFQCIHTRLEKYSSVSSNAHYTLRQQLEIAFSSCQTNKDGNKSQAQIVI